MKKTIKLSSFLILLIISTLFSLVSCKKEALVLLPNTSIIPKKINCKQLEIPAAFQNTALTYRSVQNNKAAVAPIVFIPAGSKLGKMQKKKIQQGLENVKLWYQRELPNKDIRWERIKYLRGQQDAAYYLEAFNIWDYVGNEIEQEFGWHPWKENSEGNRIALVLGRDLLGWAGGAGYPNGQGLAIVGLESLIELSKVEDEVWGTQEYWHGTVIHELGHALTLPHSDDATSIMDQHSDYKNKGLTTSEKEQVQASAVMKANQPTPIARWTFDNNFKDESGNELNLRRPHATGRKRGLIEKACYFDGTQDVVQTAPNTCNVTDQLTISTWIRPDTTGGLQTIVNKWYTKDAYFLGINNGMFEFSIATPGGTWGIAKTVKTTATAKEWQHVVGIYTGSKLQLYIDGVLKAEQAATGMIQQSERPVSIGNHPTGNGFKGLIDKVTIYEEALTKQDLLPY